MIQKASEYVIRIMHGDVKKSVFVIYFVTAFVDILLIAFFVFLINISPNNRANMQPVIAVLRTIVGIVFFVSGTIRARLVHFIRNTS
jgi:hypothetical protein